MVLVRLFVVTLVIAPMSIPAQSADQQLCDRLATQSTRAQYRPQAEARIASGGAAADFFRGCLAWDEDKSDASIAFFEAATKGANPTSDYFLWLGNAYGVKAQRANVLSQARLARKTKAAFDRAVELDPDNIAARDGLMQYYLQAPGVMGGSMTKADEQARAIKQRNAYRGGFALASIAGRQKDGARAERELRELVASYPDSVDALTSLVSVLGQRAQWSEAWRALDGAKGRSVATHPRYSYATGRLAALSGEQLERGEAALTAYLRLPPVRGNPSLSGAQLRLGQIYEKMGKPDQAKVAYRTAVTLDPRNEDAKKALKGVGG
ncbi:MAG: tetratricopeptide repeat protein [Gemmatimonadaceae bacterium]|jgi:tetratricopeptide (TPR) repeat protein|nr:tetratricopeptide repeat protein [Gemmatimonadaceae bacterium]